MTTINLSNQDSFTKFFKQFVAGEITEPVTIKFELPKNAKKTPFLRVQGKGYNGTINSLVMNVLQSHQTNIHRLYSLVKYGKVTKLKASEVESLRIIFQVDIGSSTLIIKNLELILDFIIPAVIEPTAAATLVVGLVLIFTEFGLTNYRENKNRIFIAEQNQLDRDHIAEQNQLDRDHTAEQNQLDRDHTAEQNQRDRDARERELQIIKEIIGYEQIITGSKEFLERLTRLSKHANVVKHLGQTVSPPVEKEDKEILPTSINGNYKILHFGEKTDTYFKIRLKNTETGNKFNAKLSADNRLDNVRAVILDAVQSGEGLNLNINAILVNNRLTKAVIVSIVEPEQLTTNN